MYFSHNSYNKSTKSPKGGLSHAHAHHHSAAAQSPGPHPGAGGPLPQRVHRRREQVGKRPHQSRRGPAAASGPAVEGGYERPV